MGYYTKFSLSVEPFYMDQLIPEFRDSCDSARFAMQSNGIANGDGVKWSSHEDDLKKFSKKYPDVLFILSGVGEESGDMWRKYFKGGKVQVAKARIDYDPFDESKLE